MDATIEMTNIGLKATRRDEYTDAGLVEGKKWAAIKAAFRFGSDKTSLGRVAVVSFLCLLFCIPAIAWVTVFSAFIGGKTGSYTSFGAFDGLGLPSTDVLPSGLGSAKLAAGVLYFNDALFRFSVLIPCIMIMAMGIGALVYVARQSMNGEKVRVFGDFFRGVKYTWASSLTAGLLIGSNIFLIVFCTHVFDAFSVDSLGTITGGGLAGKILTIIFSSILLIFVTIYSFYLITLSANYKVPYLSRLKDALLLTFKGFINNIIALFFVALIAGVAVLLLMWLGVTSTWGVLVWFLIFFFGLYTVSAIFAAFSQPMFNKYINAGMQERESHAATEQSYAAIRAQKAADKAAGKTPAPKKKNEPQKFVNPKKKKKNSDSGVAKNMESPFAELGRKKKGYMDEELKQLEKDREKLLAEEKPDNVENLEDISVYTDDEDE